MGKPRLRKRTDRRPAAAVPTADEASRMAELATRCSRLAKAAVLAGDHASAALMYEAKARLARALAATPFLAEVAFVPQDIPQVSYGACARHYAAYRKETGGASEMWRWAHSHRKEIRCCPRCHYTENPGHRALFSLVVRVGEATWHLHLPYKQAKRWLPRPYTLPTLAAPDAPDRVFQFGRAAYPSEIAAWNPDGILDEVAEALGADEAELAA